MKIFMKALGTVLLKTVIGSVLLTLAVLLVIGFIQLVAFYPLALVVIVMLVFGGMWVKEEMDRLKRKEKLK